MGSDFEVVSLKEIGCDVDIPETGNTLEENALQKAQYVYDHYHISCFAARNVLLTSRRRFTITFKLTLRKTTDDDKLLAILDAKYEENKKNPKKMRNYRQILG